MNDTDRRTVAAEVVRLLIARRIIKGHHIEDALGVVGLFTEDIRNAGPWTQPKAPIVKRGRGGNRRNNPITRNTVTGYGIDALDGEAPYRICSTCCVNKPQAEYKRTQKGRRNDGTYRYSRDGMCRDCRLEYQRKRYVSVRKRDELASVGIELGDGDGIECVVCHEPIVGEPAIGVAVFMHHGCAAHRAVPDGDVRQLPHGVHDHDVPGMRGPDLLCEDAVDPVEDDADRRARAPERQRDPVRGSARGAGVVEG